MLRRLSPKSQQIIDRAQDIARQYDQDYIDAEDILVAIAQADDTPAGKFLQAGGATPDALRKALQKTSPTKPADAFVTGRLPGTMHFKNIIARAIELAERFNTPAVEPEHLLLALSKEQGALALKALEDSGLSCQKVEQAFGKKK